MRLTSDGQPDAVVPSMSATRSAEPEWARYVAGVVAELRPQAGSRASCAAISPPARASRRALPSKSPAPWRSAPTTPTRSRWPDSVQAAEHAARGVPTGLLDQLASICGVEGSGLHLDCRSLEVAPIRCRPPDVAQWLVVWAGARSLAASGYADRVAELARPSRSSGRCATPDPATSRPSTIRRSGPAPVTC